MKRSLKSIISGALVLVVLLTTVLAVDISANAAGVDYSAVFNAAFYAEKNPDLAAAFGTDEAALFNHFVTKGMSEGRQASEEFNVLAYKARYADLEKVYGNNLKMYYLHYAVVGKTEGRNGRADGAAIVAAKPAAQTPAVTPATTPTATVAVNTEIPANAIKHGNGYFLTNVGPDVVTWINQQRVADKKKEVTWSQEIANCGLNRSKELSFVFSSGRPDGTPWMTAYGDNFGDYGIKEMIYKENGVITAAALENAIAKNTDRMNYILSDNFEKCGIAVYTENNVSYVIIAFSKTPEEKK